MKKIALFGIIGSLLAASLIGCGAKPAAPQASPSSEEASQSQSQTENSTPAADITKIVVGLDDQFPPMGFRDENNELVGFDIDLAKEVGKRLGIEVELQPINWAAKELELNSGKVDLLWNAFTITPERQEAMLVSSAYLNNAQVVVVKSDSAIQGRNDLAGAQIALQTGSSANDAYEADEELKALVTGAGGAKIEMDDNVAALNDLEIGRVDAVVLDKIVAEYYMTKKEGAFRILADELAPEEYGIAFKKGNQELFDKVTTELRAMVEDGTAAKISEEWFGEDIIVFE